MEGHMGAKTKEVPAAREERQVQEALDKEQVDGDMRGIHEQSMSGSFKNKNEKKKKSQAEAVRGPETQTRLLLSLLCCVEAWREY